MEKKYMKAEFSLNFLFNSPLIYVGVIRQGKKDISSFFINRKIYKYFFYEKDLEHEKENVYQVL